MIQKNEISNNEVMGLATDCLQKYIAAMGWKFVDDVIIDITEIYESVIYPEYGVSLVTNYDLGEYENQKILGKMLSQEKVILIDKSINKQSHDPRFTFTFGHEIGHAVSHMNQNEYFKCTENNIYNRQQQLQVQESQANLFAETLIMPPKLVQHKYQYYYDIKRPFRYVGAGYYYVGNQKIHFLSLAHLGWFLAKPLTRYFSNISKESLAYRMLNIGIIKNETDESMFNSMNYGFYGSKNNPNITKYIPKTFQK